MYKKLKGARVEKGITQFKMAELLDITQNTYYLKEVNKSINGKKRDFTISEANKILTILNKKYEDIFLN
jgi:DNA-binding XRE family transcriptional regulator